jgi:3-dehydroquinate synthase
VRGEFAFNFGGFPSRVLIRRELPGLEELAAGGGAAGNCLLVCDTHTEALARKVQGGPGGDENNLCVLPPGEESKSWASVERILRAAHEGGLGRDGLFVGVGGGVVGDMTAFAASVYMRGARLCLVPTTLLGMVDAAVGGKAGFDLFGMKNLAGAFFPAEQVYIAGESLSTLPEGEWKSGFAELVKTAILDEAGGEFFSLVKSLAPAGGGDFRDRLLEKESLLMDCIGRAAALKGRIVEADPRETGTRRALLNLGHTFGHALESSLGLGRVSHGEAVAWGIVRACELGRALGITPRDRGAEIAGLFRDAGYEVRAPHPLLKDPAAFMRALGGDKKKRGGRLRFVLPAGAGAALRALENDEEGLPERALRGELPL